MPAIVQHCGLLVPTSSVAEPTVQPEPSPKIGKFQPSQVRALATAAGGLEEIDFNKVTCYISFRHAETGTRINVYYTTGTVSTAMDHPRQGKNQLYRRDVDLMGLLEIFMNPRAHTGKGYRHRERADAAQGGRGTDKPELEIDTQAIADAAVEAAIKAAQDRRHSRGDKFIASTGSTAQLVLSRAVNSYVNVFAMDGTGFFIILDSGDDSYYNVPGHLHRIMQRRRSQENAAHPEYIALGSCHRFYIRFTDGQYHYGGTNDADFVRTLERVQGIRRVAFGATPDSWVILHDEGVAWGKGIPKGLKPQLRQRNPANISDISLGFSGDQFFIAHTNGGYTICYGGEEMQDLRDAIHRIDGSDRGTGARVKMVTFGYDGAWAIRYVKDLDF